MPGIKAFRPECLESVHFASSASNSAGHSASKAPNQGIASTCENFGAKYYDLGWSRRNAQMRCISYPELKQTQRAREKYLEHTPNAHTFRCMVTGTISFNLAMSRLEAVPHARARSLSNLSNRTKFRRTLGALALLEAQKPLLGTFVFDILCKKSVQLLICTRLSIAVGLPV